MKIGFRKKFLEELSKISSGTRQEIEDFVFEKLPANPTLKDWDNIEPLKGDLTFKKAFFGEYRIGIRIVGNVVIFERVRHRNDIYRIHP